MPKFSLQELHVHQERMDLFSRSSLTWRPEREKCADLCHVPLASNEDSPVANKETDNASRKSFRLFNQSFIVGETSFMPVGVVR